MPVAFRMHVAMRIRLALSTCFHFRSFFFRLFRASEMIPAPGQGIRDGPINEQGLFAVGEEVACVEFVAVLPESELTLFLRLFIGNEKLHSLTFARRDCRDIV